MKTPEEILVEIKKRISDHNTSHKKFIPDSRLGSIIRSNLNSKIKELKDLKKWIKDENDQ